MLLEYNGSHYFQSYMAVLIYVLCFLVLLFLLV